MAYSGAAPSRSGERGAQRAKTFPLFILLLLMLAGVIAGMAVSSGGVITPDMLYQGMAAGGLDGLIADLADVHAKTSLWPGALLGAVGGFVLFALTSGHGLLRSGVHLLLLTLITAIAAMLGAAVVCEHGMTLGELYHAVVRGQLLAHMQDVVARNGEETFFSGALIGGLCGAVLYVLAATSHRHHGQNRLGAPARH